MQRSFVNILTDKVEETASFYKELLGMIPNFESDWFVNLASPQNSSLELGILSRTHEIVPSEAGDAPSGVLLTFVLGDCDEIHERAKAAGLDVVEAPRNMPYGQRRMILRDPAGTMVDVSSVSAPT